VLLGVVHGRRSADVIVDIADQLRTTLSAALVGYDTLDISDQEGVVATAGAATLIESLPTGRWAVVTSGGPEVAAARLGAAGLPQPPLMITAQDVKEGKPAPEPYRLAAHRLGMSPETCLVVEDAPAGLEAGRAAGSRTVGVLGSHRANQLDADFHVPDLQAISVESTPGGPLLVTLRAPVGRTS
jgi:sugar-phosphatase